MTTRWGSTYLMIKCLLELRESIEKLNLLSAEFDISLAMWSSLEDICSVVEMPYSATMYLQTKSLMPGAFLKKWAHLNKSSTKEKQD